jgi:hypothetical protein
MQVASTIYILHPSSTIFLFPKWTNQLVTNAPGTYIKFGIKFWASSSIIQHTYSTNNSFCTKDHHKHILIWSKLQSAHATRKGMWNILIITYTLFTIGFCNQVNITKYLHLSAPFIFPLLWQTCNISIKIELNCNSNSMTFCFYQPFSYK